MRYKKRQDKFKSGFEAAIAQQLKAAGAPVDYEPDKYKFLVPETGRRCKECHGVQILRSSSYTPDFKIGNKRYIEAKGKLTAANRKRLVAFKGTFPEITILIVFQRDNHLTASKTSRYSDWAEKAGFQYSIGKVDPSWLS